MVIIWGFNIIYNLYKEIIAQLKTAYSKPWTFLSHNAN